MTEQAAHRLQDQWEITAVLIEYCYALDRMDLPRLAALFTEDCSVDYGPDERLQSHGAHALAKSLERMWRWSRTSHHLSNVLVEFDEDNAANVRSYVYAWHERSDGSTATILGQYHDRFVRSEGRWRIGARRMYMNGCDAGFTVDINPLERTAAPAGWTAPDLDRKR